MLPELRPEPTPTYSDQWYRLAATTPRLSPHARISAQRMGESIVHIVEDPAGGNFFRLSEPAYLFVGLLDGTCTVDDAWNVCCMQLGDDAPTQRECIDVLSRLQYFGLLSGDLPLSQEMVSRRQSDARDRRRKRRTGGGTFMSLSVPILNPEPWLERLSYVWKAVFSTAGFVVYLVTLLVAGYLMFGQREAFSAALGGVLDPSNLAGLAVLFVVLRAWHELGHAAACKAMGGRCTEIGLMLVAFVFPFPYCDTSAAWRFPQVHKRVIVSAGGMLFETFIAAIAAIAWCYTSESFTLTRALLLNTVVLSGVTTIVFNANPLLRYDGYFILSDIAGIPNLAQRASELGKFMFQRRVLKIATVRPPTISSMGQFWFLFTYYLLATPYRLFVTMLIVLALWSDERYITLGALIAVVGSLVWLVWPVLKWIGFLIGSPQLLGRRARAAGLIGGVIAAVILLVALVPAPAPYYATGTLEPRRSQPIRPLEDGFVVSVHATPGQRVTKGDLLVTLRNEEVITQLAQARADQRKAQILSDSAAQRGGAEQSIAQLRLFQANARLERLQERVDSLRICALDSGIITPAPAQQPKGGDQATDAVTELTNLEGRFVSKGTLLGTVATTDDLVVRALVSDRDHAYIFGSQSVGQVASSFRVKGDAGNLHLAKVARAAPVGSREAVAPSLTTPVGGEVAIDTLDPSRLLVPQFSVELSPNIVDPGWQAGLRARVRFETPWAPLGSQFIRWGQQFLTDRSRM